MAPTDHLTVRDARVDELEAIRELTWRAYRELASIMTPSAWAVLERAMHLGLAADVPGQRIVAERDGRIVGCVLLVPPSVNTYGLEAAAARSPELRLLAVAPEARSLGAGRALVEECIRRARASGATELGLHTSESMQSAVRLYQRMGFVRAPELDFHPPGAELVEAYRLPLAGRWAAADE